MVKNHRVTPATQQRRDRDFGQLMAWLATMPHNKTVETCTTGDLLVYFKSEYLKQHMGTHTADGALVCAPTSFEQCVSHIAQCFDQIGRRGQWNPARSHEILDLKKSYRGQVVAAGVREVSAVPLKHDEEVQTLMHLVEAIATETRLMHRAAMARDGCMRVLLWATKMRGAEVGALRVSNLLLPDGQPALSKLIPVHAFQPGDELWIRPDRTKTEPGNRVKVRIVTALAETVLSPTLWLHCLLVTASKAGAPVQEHLFRPMTPSQLGFKEAPYKSSALNSMYKKRMADAGVVNGHTPHSSKRGALQAEAAAGKQMPDLLKDACMVSPVVMQRYLDPHRHVQGWKCFLQA